MNKSRGKKQRGFRLRLESLESRRVLAALVGLPAAAPTFELNAPATEASVREIAPVRSPHKFFAKLSFDVTSNAKSQSVLPGTILPVEVIHRPDPIASVPDPIQPSEVFTPELNVEASIPIAAPVVEVHATPTESTLVVESIESRLLPESVAAPPVVVFSSDPPVTIDAASNPGAEPLATEILLIETNPLDFTNVNREISPASLLRDAIGFIAEDRFELDSESFDAGEFSLNDDAPELQRSESSDSNQNEGSHSIADDADLTPRIDPEPTDLDDREGGDSIVSGSVDISRSIAAGKLDQVSRHLLMAGHSMRTTSLGTPRLADVQPGLSENTQRAHRSTNASIASYRAMELANHLSTESIALVSGMQAEGSVRQARLSGVDRVGAAEFDPVRFRMTPTETPLPLDDLPGKVTPDPASGDESREPATGATSSRVSASEEISNPLVSVTLLVMSCLGGLVINRHLDPDDDRPGAYFEPRF